MASIDEIGLARCTGCFGCQAACARGAVDLSLDADGFYKPIVDREKCNECGLCRLRCPVIPDPNGESPGSNWAEPRAYAAWTNDPPTRLASSSGGIFSELARQVIDAGGAVAGCVWGDAWSPEHVLARNWGDVGRMRGSKYVPSRVGDVYQQVIAALRRSEAPVLFSGAPCQVAAMERALNPAQRPRVLLVEFICHGVPSLRVFHRYLEELFQGEAVGSYTFRDKSIGGQAVVGVSASGRRYRRPMASDDFVRGFAVEHLYVMESCHNCMFARLPRGGDITLGDYWGCPEEWNDPGGVSVVLANTAAGSVALESLVRAGTASLKPTGLATATAYNARAAGGSYPIPHRRRAFLDGMARGESFAALKAKHFPNRWQVLWRSFRESRSKARFIADVARARLRRLRSSR